jgi:hypothetical protein
MGLESIAGRGAGGLKELGYLAGEGAALYLVKGAPALVLDPKCFGENRGNEFPRGLGEKGLWLCFWLKRAKVEVSTTLACW